MCGENMNMGRREGTDWMDCPRRHHATTPRRVWQDAHVTQLIRDVERFLADARDEPGSA
jgi:hypothetical protein